MKRKIITCVYLAINLLIAKAQQAPLKRWDTAEVKRMASFLETIAPFDSLVAVETAKEKGKGSISFIKYNKATVTTGLFVDETIVNSYMGARGSTKKYPNLLFIDSLSTLKRKQMHGKISSCYQSLQKMVTTHDSCLKKDDFVDDAATTSYLFYYGRQYEGIWYYAFDELFSYCPKNKILKQLNKIKRCFNESKENIDIEQKLKELLLASSSNK